MYIYITYIKYGGNHSTDPALIHSHVNPYYRAWFYPYCQVFLKQFRCILHEYDLASGISLIDGNPSGDHIYIINPIPLIGIKHTL